MIGHVGSERTGIEVRWMPPRVEAQGVIVEYECVNDGEITVYFACRTLLHECFSPRPYTTLDGEELVMAYETPPVPPGVRLYAPAVPYMARIAPGESLRDRIECEHPLLEWHAYLPWDFRKQPEVRKVSRICIRTHWLFVSDADFVQDAGEGMFRASGRIYPVVQRFEMAAPLTVLCRSEDIQRLPPCALEQGIKEKEQV